MSNAVLSNKQTSHRGSDAAILVDGFVDALHWASLDRALVPRRGEKISALPLQRGCCNYWGKQIRKGKRSSPLENVTPCLGSRRESFTHSTQTVCFTGFPLNKSR